MSEEFGIYMRETVRDAAGAPGRQGFFISTTSFAAYFAFLSVRNQEKEVLNGLRERWITFVNRYEPMLQQSKGTEIMSEYSKLNAWGSI